MVKKVSSIIFYIIAALFLGVYGLTEITENLALSEFGKLFLLCGSCIFLYLGGLILSKYRKDNKSMKTNLWIFFGLYLLLFITLFEIKLVNNDNDEVVSTEKYKVYIDDELQGCSKTKAIKMGYIE